MFRLINEYINIKMEKQIILSDPIISRTEYKRKFSFGELYRALMYTPRAMSKLISNKKSNLVDKKFIERLQLAITEVNGCPACSYQHTKMALQMGMSNEEISSFLSGGDDFIRPEEAKAIIFAQHFADARGFPKKYAFDSIINEYGEEQAEIIFSACQVMLTGNIYGIPYSAFSSRRKGIVFKESSIFYELSMIIGGILILPIALILGVLRGFIGLSNKKLDLTTEA